MTAELHVAIYCGDERQNVTGELRHLAALEFPAASFERVVETGVRIKLTVNTTGPVRHVKAIVYDSAADRLGSAVRTLR